MLTAKSKFMELISPSGNDLSVNSLYEFASDDSAQSGQDAFDKLLAHKEEVAEFLVDAPHNEYYLNMLKQACTP